MLIDMLAASTITTVISIIMDISYYPADALTPPLLPAASAQQPHRLPGWPNYMQGIGILHELGR
jgi:hypothetical protein